MINGQGLVDFHYRQVYDCNVFIKLKKNADGDCKLAVETLQDSNLSSKSVVYNKVALFSLSKFQYISDSLHSCTDRQNIQSHCFSSLVPGPSRNYCFKTPQNEISISANLWVRSVHQVNAR